MPFDALDTNPYQVILLDEFEKCHKSVQRLFMRVFDEGQLKTNRGKTIDFSKSIIIATTNATYERNAKPMGFTSGSVSAKKKVKDLAQYFDPELLNRFSKRICFSEISKEVFMEILRDTYREEIKSIKNIKAHIGLPDEMPEDDVVSITEDIYEPLFGARPIRKKVRDYIDAQLI